jgi:hypothetical protein
MFGNSAEGERGRIRHLLDEKWRKVYWANAPRGLCTRERGGRSGAVGYAAHGVELLTATHSRSKPVARPFSRRESKIAHLVAQRQRRRCSRVKGGGEPNGSGAATAGKRASKCACIAPLARQGLLHHADAEWFLALWRDE